ncbi:MAG: hypothetical protein MK116_11005 [Phycisphaerales bacterium]|nr:hypothetical protein [Phycisphaerales bacterium]
MIESLILLSAVAAQDASADEPTTDAGAEAGQATLVDQEPELTFEFTPGVWLLRIRGDASNGPGDAPDLRLDTQLGLTDLNAAFRGEAVITRGDWSVEIAGSTFNSSGTTIAEEVSRWGSVLITPGLEFTSTLDMAFVAAEVKWQAWTPLGEAKLTEANPLRLSVGPHVGVSWLDIDQDLTTAFQTVSNGHAWWSVWGGGQLEFEFDMSRFISWIDSIRVQAGAGLGGTPVDGGFMWHAGGGVNVFFTPNIAVTIAYRYEKYSLEDGDWKINPNFQGLFLGATVQF